MLPHGFTNVGDEPGELLGFMTPAGFENYFIEVASLPSRHGADPAALQRILRKYDQELVQG